MMADGFLSRWSKRKAGKEIEPEKVQQEAPPSTVAPTLEAQAIPPVTLEDVEKIDRFDPDFSAFMRPDVDPSVQQAALKKMFSDPHFNVMDGLDIYIDDYSNPEPLPAEMLKRLVQSDLLGIFNKPEELVAGVLSPSEKISSPEQKGEGASEALTQSDLRSEQPQQNPMDPEAIEKIAQHQNIKEDKA
jgi:hypothetical protein